MASIASRLKYKPISILLPVGVLCIAMALELGGILWLNDGHFSYTLDDPYIHLALADRIASGHYGINSSEYSAPASSILWPVLLAAFARWPFQEYIPLALNFLACLVTVALLGLVIRAALAGVEEGRRYLATGMIVVALMFATNLIGLALTGMEHSWQVALAVLMVACALLGRGRSLAIAGLGVACVAGPLVRYEFLALALPALAYLAWRRHYVVALVCGGVLLASLVGFSLFLRSLGLELLPASVLAQSLPREQAFAGIIGQLRATRQLRGNLEAIEGSLLAVGGLALQLWGNLRAAEGSLLAIGGLALLGYCMFGQEAETKPIAGVTGLAILLHLAFSKVGRGGGTRYDIYIWLTMLLVVLYIYRDGLARAVQRGSPAVLFLFLGLFVLLAGSSRVYATVMSPLAANNIYDQQYQMRRFAQDYYQAPVAVNDLGWVSYRNDQYVLDLWGLASAEALRLRGTRQDPGWMNELANKYNVRLALIYDTWLPALPEDWIPVAKLYLDRKAITPAHNVVTFYALDEQTAIQVEPLLKAFSLSLPPGARLEIDGAEACPKPVILGKAMRAQ